MDAAAISRLVVILKNVQFSGKKKSPAPIEVASHPPLLQHH